MANGVFNRGYYNVGKYDLTAITLKAMLVTTGFVFNPDLDFVDDGTANDPASFEISAAGYSRQTLGSVTLNEDDTNDFSYLDCADPSFGSLASGQTVGGMVVFRYSSSGGTTSDTGQDIISYYTLTATPTNGGAIGVTIASSSAGGLLKIASTS